MLRARVGDTVELTPGQRPRQQMIHSIDLHAVTGGHGGGEHAGRPGQEKAITFKALNPGLYVVPLRDAVGPAASRRACTE